MNSVVQDAAAELAGHMAAQLEKELRGAWRAGFDYVHVYGNNPKLVGPELTEGFTVARYTLASNQERAPRPSGRRYLHSYDLTSVPIDETREALTEGTKDDTHEDCVVCGEPIPDEYGKHDEMAPVYADGYVYHLGCEDGVFDEVLFEVGQ